MQLVPDATSYATRKNAVRKLTQVFGKGFEQSQELRWGIIAQADGRFSPFITLDSCNGNVGAVAQAGICIIGS